MDALKNRVGAFTEGILTMACPVLLAVTLKKANLNGEGGELVGMIAIILAVANLIISLAAFVFLAIANMLAVANLNGEGGEPGIHEKALARLYYGSKLLVHLCAFLQSILAYMILLIKISFKTSIIQLVMTILFCLFPIWWSICMQSLKNGHQRDNESYDSFHDKLEKSMDILAAVTSFLFQMLVALALESQASNDQDNSHLHSSPLGLTFVFCLIGTCLMLAGAVLLPIQFDDDAQRQEKCDKLCMAFHVMSVALTIFFTVVVPQMLTKLCTEWAVGMVIFPWISIGAVFVVSLCKPGASNHRGNSDQAKTAPLGLTKAMFAGFQAVLIPSFSSGTVSDSTKAFICITAGVVVSGLLWRFLTHLAPMKEAVVAADVACLLTQFLVMGAAISFLLVAMEALAQGSITCQTPCNSGQQTKDSVLNCFRNMTEYQVKNWTSVLSSVPC